MKTWNDMTITMGSGDVFTDLGFSPVEARNLRIRSEMMTALRKFIEKEGLTHADAAKRLKVSQPRVSDLTRGKIIRFSLDTLLNMLTERLWRSTSGSSLKRDASPSQPRSGG